MQNKGAIRLFAIALALVCVYQLTFTYFTKSVESDAAEYAEEQLAEIKKERPDVNEIKVLDSLESRYLKDMGNETVYNFIGLKKFTYNDCKEKEINLGLDLKGGMNVTLEVSVVDVIRNLAGPKSSDPTFVEALKRAKKLQQNSQDDYVTLLSRAIKEIDPNANLYAFFNNRNNVEKITDKSDAAVIEFLTKETNAAIDNSFMVLRNRIDRFGVAQPNIQEDISHKGRILIELPGIKDPERVRKLLQGTAKLEFWETYDNTEVFNFLSEANAKLKEINDLQEAATSDIVKTDKDTVKVVEEVTNDPIADLVNESTDTTEITLEEQLSGETAEVDSLQRIKDNPLFSILTPSINNSNQLMRGPVVGLSDVNDTASVMEILNRKEIKDLFPRDIKLAWSIKPFKTNENVYTNTFMLIALKGSGRDFSAALEGDVIKDASVEFGQNSANAEVSMVMKRDGAKKWENITGNNIDRSIAIVLDSYVYSYPNVNAKISGGRSSITGGFTPEEATDLANVLKSGKLPAPARIIEEAIVGPSLGQEAINAGMNSFLIAFLVVLLYMIFYYSRGAGLVADIALLANIFFIFGVLAAFGAVLTLPGIAGIILTIGMSVDANVLIYERIREELTAGKGLKLAISDGYKNALSAIIDANVTTLLTGIILYIFGSGPIKGFATTLVIGILTSLFSAIFITRLIFEWWIARDKNVTFSTKLTENAFTKLKINFIGKRKIFYAISAFIVVLGVASLFIKGLNQGIDFVGGRSFLVRSETAINPTEAKEALALTFGEAPEVKTFGAENQIKITTKYLIDSDATDADDQVEAKLFEGLKSIIGDNITYDDFINDYKMSSQKVGATIADDIKVSAIWAIIFSLLVIFLYILVRFKNWQFGLGALTALVHDVLIVLGLFSIFYGILPFSLEIDQAFIAAILTVVGYSINDTVVVFDRIREYLALYKKEERSDILNRALNSTLSRTFSTSLSTFFVLLTIFVFGGEVIRGFIFALLVGVVVGTYSSLFIATPIVFDTIKKDETTRVLKGKRIK